MSDKRIIHPTLWEQQSLIFSYSAAVSMFSPAANLYQLVKLNPELKRTTRSLTKTLLVKIYPTQTLLRIVQMNSSSFVKEHTSPWIAFACIGVLQGGVYGHANIYLSRRLGLGYPAWRSMFRGVGWAAARDTISQGCPFMFSQYLNEQLISPLYDGIFGNSFSHPNHSNSNSAEHIKKMVSVFAMTIPATYLSQGFHNLQTTMQSKELSYFHACRSLWTNNGISMFYKGAEARIGLLLIINVLNEFILKPAWAPIEIEDVFDDSNVTIGISSSTNTPIRYRW